MVASFKSTDIRTNTRYSLAKTDRVRGRVVRGVCIDNLDTSGTSDLDMLHEAATFALSNAVAQLPDQTDKKLLAVDNLRLLKPGTALGRLVYGRDRTSPSPIEPFLMARSRHAGQEYAITHRLITSVTSDSTGLFDVATTSDISLSAGETIKIPIANYGGSTRQRESITSLLVTDVVTSDPWSDIEAIRNKINSDAVVIRANTLAAGTLKLLNAEVTPVWIGTSTTCVYVVTYEFLYFASGWLRYRTIVSTEPVNTGGTANSYIPYITISAAIDGQTAAFEDALPTSVGTGPGVP